MKGLMEVVQNITLDSKPVCPYCHQEKKLETYEFGPLGKRTVPIMCECEVKAEKEQMELDEKLEKKRRYETLFRQSRLGKRFENSSFETYEVTRETKKMYDLAKDFTVNYDRYKREGKGLLFSSIPGTGKTHLVSAITKGLLNDLVAAVMITVPDILMQIRETYNKGSNEGTEKRILYGLSDCDVLVLDDIGAEKTTDWTMEKLFVVIDSRYRNMKPTIFTTNCTSQELKERIGDRTFSRIMDMTIPLRIEAPDYRLRNFK